MTRRIVVGIDGSAESGAALEWAIARARPAGADLELVNAYSPQFTHDFYGFHGMGAVGDQGRWFTEYSEELLGAASARVAQVAPTISVTSTSTIGPPAHVLADASKGAALVVVGRRGLGAAGSALLGSVSNRLSVEAEAPLVVVTEGALPVTGPVVVGVDGSEYGTAALRFALAEAAAAHAPLRAVTAFDYPDVTFQGDPELIARMRAGVEADAAAIATQALDALGAAATSVAVEHVTVQGAAAEAILAQASDARLIVVGSHGKGLVRRVLLGSVSRQVLHDSERPVAIVNLPAEVSNPSAP